MKRKSEFFFVTLTIFLALYVAAEGNCSVSKLYDHVTNVLGCYQPTFSTEPTFKQEKPLYTVMYKVMYISLILTTF